MGAKWLVVSLVTFMAGAGAAPAEAWTTTRVSVGPGGIQSNGSSVVNAISADGRFVAFSSAASNLIAGDHNGEEDVFLRDLVRGETYLISTSTGGLQGNDLSENPAVSADGRFVCFDSSASNLVPGDTNGDYDVFLRDRARSTTMRINLRPGGHQSKGSVFKCDISSDGRLVAFDAEASRLVPDDTNNEMDIFIYDRVTKKVERVNLGNRGQQARGGYSILPSISASGRFVAFQSIANNLVAEAVGPGANIYVRDRQENKTIRVSRGLGGAPIDVGSSNPAISADGRFVAFDSNSTNLVPGDTNDIDDVFVYDLQTGRTTRVSVATDGQQGNSDSGYPSISADGRFVVFHSYATNLVPGDTNDAVDVFLHDCRTGVTSRVSVSSSGAQANGDSSYHFAISPRGDKVAFISDATNLVPGDTNGKTDVFLRQLSRPPM